MMTGNVCQQAWHQAWCVALDDLELDVTEAEHLLEARRGTPAPAQLRLVGGWQPPAVDGPLPGDLRMRAQAILARQLRVAEDLVKVIAVGHRELQVARRMDSGARDRSQPVFLDRKF
jgi:hypothetical protein